MASKKIKLKASLKSINSKSSTGKRKPLKKLNSVLATSSQPGNFSKKLLKCETLKLKDIIRSECLQQGGISGKEFATANRICLGLGSGLREISNQRMSWVLISQGIRPKFIIDQVACMAKQKKNTVPVHVVEDLEVLTEQIFGIKSSLVVFPNKLPEKLSEWISKRKEKEPKPPKEAKQNRKTKNTLSDANKLQLQIKNPQTENSLEIKCIFLRKEPNVDRVFIPKTIVGTQKKIVKKPSDDFISLSGNNGRSTSQQLGNKKTAKLPKIEYEEYDLDYEFPNRKRRCTALKREE